MSGSLIKPPVVAPPTTDVIHVIFTCCDADISSHMTEALNSYYDYLKGYLATHQLDRQNTGLDFDTFWNIIGKTLRAELVEEVSPGCDVSQQFNILYWRPSYLPWSYSVDRSLRTPVSPKTTSGIYLTI